MATAGGSSEVQSEGTCDLFVSVRTLATCNFVGTQSTCAFYTDAAAETCESFENELVEDAIVTIAAEILELDTMGFDETLPLDETVDM